jgi:hypothetical protein
MEHPLRREMLEMERHALYQAALETVIRGLRAIPENNKEVRE